MFLRFLTSIDLFMTAEYYASYNDLSEMKSKVPAVLIHMILLFGSFKSSNGDIFSAILDSHEDKGRSCPNQYDHELVTIAFFSGNNH